MLEVERRSDGTYVELAYGTSADTSANRGEEIHVSRPEAMAAAGLHRRTRFVGARRVLVRVDHSGFDVNPRYGTPVLGRLDPRDMERMNCVRAHIKAFRDAAAEGCCARQRRSVSTAGLIVEKRGSRRALRERIATAQGRRIIR